MSKAQAWWAVIFSFVLLSCSRNKLIEYQEILPGECLVSDNRKYKLALLYDGNLVLYKGLDEIAWASNTSGIGVTKAVMDPNGNLLLCNNDYKSFWSTQLPPNPHATLLLQNDGNLVIYKNEIPVWQTNTGIK